MQFSTIVLSAVALFGTMSFAAPAPGEKILETRSSCQVGDIFGAGDAACSASVCTLLYFLSVPGILLIHVQCLKNGTYHGGYCNKKK